MDNAPNDTTPKAELWYSSAGLMDGEDGTEQGTARFMYDGEMSFLRSGWDAMLKEDGKLKMLDKILQRHPLDDWAAPAHMLVVERFVNDTEAVGFELRRFGSRAPSPKRSEEGQEERARRLERGEKYELRIDWRDTFTRLLVEEKARQAMSREWASNSSFLPSRSTPTFCLSIISIHPA